MIASLVPILAYFKPGYLTAFHAFEAMVEELVELATVDHKHLCDSPTLIEVDKLAIIIAGLVLVVDGLTWLGEGTATLLEGQELKTLSDCD